MKKILTIILDGFGMREDIYGNAIKNAGMSNFINIWNKYPHCLLKTSGKSVGLKENQASNSEIGHKILGSGKKINSKLNIATKEIDEGLMGNQKFNEMCNYLKVTKKSIHIIFLASYNDNTSNIEHLKKVINKLEEKEISNIYLHLITDGEESSKNNFVDILPEIEKIKKNTKISTICGRYYALNNREDYDKTLNYYELLINGKGVQTPSISRIIDICYKRKMTDEFIPPIKTVDYIPIDEKDVILMLNVGKANQRQIASALSGIPNKVFEPLNLKLKIYTLFDIGENIKHNYLFEEEKLDHTLVEYLDDLGLNQARIYESVKEESSEYYLDGAKSIELDDCDNYVVPTPKIDMLDKKPEMNALTVAKTAISCMEKDYDFILVNFANADSVGHTGNYKATINGLQAIDVCLGKMIEVANDNFYKVVIVGSHANADTIIDRDNNLVPNNTTSPVPFIIMDKKVKLKNGDLTQFLPTLLNYMDISLPKSIKKSENLLVKK